MQFKIPQDVQMEDKIVGPLTLKQLTIVCFGGGIDYFLYISLAKVYVLVVWIVPVALIAILTLAIAFLKIQGMTFIEYVFAALEYHFIPRKRVWDQGAGEVFVSITQPAPKTKEQLRREAKMKKLEPKNVSNVQEITRSLDAYSQLLKQA